MGILSGLKEWASDLGDYGKSIIGFDEDWHWDPRENNIVTGTADYTGDVLGHLGIVDDETSDRANDELQASQAAANAELDYGLAPQFTELQKAGYGRSLGDNLDRYGSEMNDAMSGTTDVGMFAKQQMNASDPTQVGNYFQNRNKFVGGGTSKALAGSAGGGLNKGISTQQLNQQAGQMWDKAFSDSMGNAKNNLSVAGALGRGYGQQGNLATQQLNANNQPMLDYLQLNNDRAMQRYAGNIGLTQAAGTAAGQSRSIL